MIKKSGKQESGNSNTKKHANKNQKAAIRVAPCMNPANVKHAEETVRCM